MTSAPVKPLYVGLGLGVMMILLVSIIAGHRAPEIQQPFPFNHAKHMKGDWKCANCHPFVDQQAFAGIPRAADCVECHKDEMPKHPENKAMRQETDRLSLLVAQGKDLPWVQVHRVAPWAYFSHRRHVEVAKLDCKVCHGDVAKMTTPFTHPAFPQTEVELMAWCKQCHEHKRASTDCASCHK
jgi:menaquinone reductase, multiheme cytochrome c subunit